MEQKIQLLHPSGKKAISVSKGKYDLIKPVIISMLQSKGASTHEEILRYISDDLKKNNIRFEGSLEWYLEWVKLDLEAKKEIRRVGDKSPVKFVIS